jgi:hypothetical protein
MYQSNRQLSSQAYFTSKLLQQKRTRSKSPLHPADVTFSQPEILVNQQEDSLADLSLRSVGMLPTPVENNRILPIKKPLINYTSLRKPFSSLTNKPLPCETKNSFEQSTDDPTSLLVDELDTVKAQRDAQQTLIDNLRMQIEFSQ